MRVAAQCLGDAIVFRYFPNTIAAQMPERQIRVLATARKCVYLL